MNEVIFLGFTGWDLVAVAVLAVGVAFLLRKMADFIDESVFKLHKKSNAPEELDLETVPWRDYITETELTYCFRDGYPVTLGHLLFVPKYNTIEAIEDCFREAYQTGNQLQEDGTIDGFNVGLNSGNAAGQTIDWPHVHLIPRRNGDIEDPTGGVRNIIPKQGNYKSSSYNLPK
jgi:diadenosine tetraphosphate (Ap4A) HIT family hydrolase